MLHANNFLSNDYFSLILNDIQKKGNSLPTKIKKDRYATHTNFKLSIVFFLLLHYVRKS